MKIAKKSDKILIIFIIIVSLLFSGVLILRSPDNANREVVIRIKNEIVKKIPLIFDDEARQFQFEFNQNIGTIEMKNGKVRMLKMDKEICPRGICSDFGWIDKSYQSIVCLPNKIIVTIEGVNDINEIEVDLLS